jgi:hypothetical protein
MLKNNEISLPCGKCACCKIIKRKDMSVRLSHEASLYDKCCFITLTYNDDNIPMTSAVDWKKKNRTKEHEETIKILRGGVFGIPTLLPADVQKFMKRFTEKSALLKTDSPKLISRLTRVM